MRDPNLSRFPSSRAGDDMDKLFDTEDIRRLFNWIMTCGGTTKASTTSKRPHISTKRTATNPSTIVFMIVNRYSKMKEKQYNIRNLVHEHRSKCGHLVLTQEVSRRTTTKASLATTTTAQRVEIPPHFNDLYALVYIMKTIFLCIALWITVSWSSNQKTESRGDLQTKKTCFADLTSAAMDVRGKWVQKPSPTPIYGKLSCPIEWSKYACANQSCYRNHTFVVTSCVSEHLLFEPKGFLKTLAGRTVAFIGDSLTRQHFISTICHLHRHAVPEMKHQVCDRISFQSKAVRSFRLMSLLPTDSHPSLCT